MYHNITEPGIDPWELAVSPENFKQHLEVLRKYRVLSVPGFADDVRKKSVVSNSIALTFDDGYEDNFLNARPLLEEYRTPAMFFISTGYLGGKIFWWDELDQLFLTGMNLPEKLSIKIGNENFEFSLGEDAMLTKEMAALQSAWYWHQPAPTKRGILYFEIWKRLRPLPQKNILEKIEELQHWAGNRLVKTEKRAMTTDQLLALKNNVYITTGIHTRTHPALAAHPAAVQHTEINACKQELLDMGMDASHIAFPYGDFNNDTIGVCRELNISAAFTTSERMVTKNTNHFQIGRFQVRNIDGNAFEKQLQKWMTDFPS